MDKRHVKALTALAVVVFMFSLLPIDAAQGQTQTLNYTLCFELLNAPDGSKGYELNLTIPQGIYSYYVAKNHLMYSEQDFAHFVTPSALKAVADSLWQIYNNTEDFTNGVLMLVHQIHYQETLPVKYPVETLVEGKGDCDLFAFIAASILKAGGIDCVLLYYRVQEHMEVGVALAAQPKEARTQVYFVEHEGVPYYIAECTGEQWRTGWRVGECPTAYQNITGQVIELGDGVEQSSIGQISANLQMRGSSSLTLRTSSSLLLETWQVTLSGQILPQTPNENVTLHANIDGTGWTPIGTALTGQDGSYSFNWTPPSSGSVAFQANWTGNRHYDGATSDQTSVYFISLYIIPIITAAIAVILLAAYALLLTKKKNPQQPPPQTQENSETPPPNEMPESESIANKKPDAEKTVN